jgi:hypothetical protein
MVATLLLFCVSAEKEDKSDVISANTIHAKRIVSESDRAPDGAPCLVIEANERSAQILLVGKAAIGKLVVDEEQALLRLDHTGPELDPTKLDDLWRNGLVLSARRNTTQVAVLHKDQTGKRAGGLGVLTVTGEEADLRLEYPEPNADVTKPDELSRNGVVLSSGRDMAKVVALHKDQAAICFTSESPRWNRSQE